MIFRLLLVICILSFFACDKSKKELTEQEAVQLVNKELLKNIELLYSDSGKLVLKIVAPEMLRHIKDGVSKDEFTKGLVTTFYQDGIISNVLSSNYAIRVPEEGKTYLSDHVVLNNPKGEKLETSELIWNERDGRIKTDKFVRLSRQDEIIHAYGFESDQNFLKGILLSSEAKFPSKKILGEIDEEKEE
ncbi:MAG: LPS export ABC transporter periplasmic protein LptC [Saprospiraceae bacterium]|nr:LPS export ABC transporter periplasmic protein LptC [Saprospiraceae bacterium]HRG34554.1 LPS export ABC transporter periplasmic protein LptC [Saprospiraceae bacterium]